MSVPQCVTLSSKLNTFFVDQILINYILCSKHKYYYLPILLSISPENQGLTGHVIFLPRGKMDYWDGLLARLPI